MFTPGKNVFCRVEGSAAELAKSVRMLGFVLLIDFQHMVVCDAEQRGGRPSKIWQRDSELYMSSERCSIGPLFFLSEGFHQERMDNRNAVTHFLNRAWELYIGSRGLSAYQMSNKLAFYFDQVNVPNPNGSEELEGA